MDINSILLLQEEQQITANEMNDAASATSQTAVHQSALYFLTAAAEQAHTIASTSASTTPAKTPSEQPSHNIANVGGAPGNSWTNNYPPANGDMDPPQGPTSDPSVPPYETSANNPNADGPGYLDKLYMFLLNISQDPDDLAQGQIFLQYLQNLSADGLLYPGSKCDQLLQNMANFDGGVSIQQWISKYITANASLAYFEGFNGNPVGNASARAWIAQQLQILNGLGVSNTYTAEMQQDLTSVNGWFQGNPGQSLYDQSHFDGTNYYMMVPVIGKVIWDQGQSANPKGGSMDNFNIYEVIVAGGIAQTPDPMIDQFDVNGLNREYRMQIFDQLMKQYKDDPSLLLVMFILMAYGNQCDSQLNGASDQTDRQTFITNQMSALTNLAGSIGTMTPQQALQFMQQLQQVTGLVNTMHSTESYATSFTESVYTTFGNMTVTFTASNGTTYTNIPLSQAFNMIYPNGASGGPATGFTAADWATALNKINPPPATGGGTSPSTPPTQLQTYLSALQQADADVSQQSKTISTLSASVSNLLDQVLKVLGFYLNPSTGGGGGYTALVGSIVGNQVSH